MKIRVRCDCGQTWVASDQLAGTETTCLACRSVLQLPRLDEVCEPPASVLSTETELDLTSTEDDRILGHDPLVTIEAAGTTEAVGNEGASYTPPPASMQPSPSFPEMTPLRSPPAASASQQDDETNTASLKWLRSRGLTASEARKVLTRWQGLCEWVRSTSAILWPRLCECRHQVRAWAVSSWSKFQPRIQFALGRSRERFQTLWSAVMTFTRAKFRDAPPPMQFAVGAVATMATCAMLWFVGWMMFSGPVKTKHAESPINTPVDHLDERMMVVAEEGGGGFVAYRPVIEAVWTGPVDDKLIRNATGVLYERLRATVNPYLATIHQKSKGKLFLKVWLHPQAPDYELAYLVANSGELAHVIPPWKDAVVEFCWPIDLGSQPEQRRSLDPSSRPMRKEEDLYYAYRATISRVNKVIQKRDGESTVAWLSRLDAARATVRQRFLQERGLTEKQLRRIEAHHYLWTWGEKVTPERIEEYLNPSSVVESP